MKQIAILTGLLLWGALGLQAQKRSASMRALKPMPAPAGGYYVFIAPLALAYSTLDAGVGRRMSGRTSLLAQGHFGFRKIQLWEALGGRYFAVGGRLEYRHYLGRRTASFRESLDGPYLAGWLKAQDARVRATLQKKDYTLLKSLSLTPGLGAGWKFPLTRKWPNVTFDLSVGGGYRIGKVSGRYAEKSRSILFKDRGLVPAVSFRVGYALGAPAADLSGEIQADKSPAIAFHDQYSRRERKSIEKALLRRGFDPGKADGRFDANTIRAIRQFQQKQGLGVDGMAGKATLKRLKGK